MSYTFSLFDGSTLNLGDLQIRGASGSKVMIEINKYLNWLELPAIQRSSNPKVQEFMGLNIQKGNIEERLKQALPDKIKEQLIIDLENLDCLVNNFLVSNANIITQATTDEEVDIDRAFDIFFRVLKNLKPDIKPEYLDEMNYTYEEVLAFLKTINDVKNNNMKSFLTASSI